MPALKDAPRNSDPMRVVAKNEAEREIAQVGSRRMAPVMAEKNPRFQIVIGDNEAPIEVPAAAAAAFFEIFTELARGNAVCIVPQHAELSTQEAAEILNVSRPYLMTLVKAQKIPARKVGNRNRIFYEDLLRYKRQEDEARQQVIAQMVRLAEVAGDDD